MLSYSVLAAVQSLTSSALELISVDVNFDREIYTYKAWHGIIDTYTDRNDPRKRPRAKATTSLKHTARRLSAKTRAERQARGDAP